MSGIAVRDMHSVQHLNARYASATALTAHPWKQAACGEVAADCENPNCDRWFSNTIPPMRVPVAHIGCQRHAIPEKLIATQQAWHVE